MMSVQSQVEVGEYIAMAAKRKKITLSNLAKKCNISRTTLYRVLNGIAPLSNALCTILASELGLSKEEQAEFQFLLFHQKETTISDGTIAVLNHLFCAFPLGYDESYLEFICYDNGKQEFCTKSETLAHILNHLNQDTSEVHLYINGCLDIVTMAFVQELFEALLRKSSNTVAEHLVHFPAHDEMQMAQVFSGVAKLLKYQSYRVSYTENGLTSTEEMMFPNGILMKHEYINEAKSPTSEYFFIVLRQEKPCHCFCFKDSALFQFFFSNYCYAKVHYSKSLIHLQNIMALGNTLEDFEQGKQMCLLKPDLCYNLISPQAYESMFARMTETEKLSMLKKLTDTPNQPSKVAKQMEMILENVTNRYKFSQENNNVLFCCKSGLIHFAQTGHMTDNIFFMPAFSIFERKIIFGDLVKRLQDENDPFDMVVMESWILGEGVVVSINADRGVLIDYGVVQKIDINQNILIENKQLSQLLYNYTTNHLRNCEIAFTKQRTIDFLNNIIRRYK